MGKRHIWFGIVTASALFCLKADDVWDWWCLRGIAADAEASVADVLARYAEGWDADCLHQGGGAATDLEGAQEIVDPRITDNLRRHVGQATLQEVTCTDFSGGGWGKNWPIFGHCRAVIGGRRGTAVLGLFVSPEAGGWRIGGLSADVLSSDVPPTIVPPNELMPSRDGVCS